jgi:predicted nuclease of predicted toxin-antitoxin system
MRVKVDEDLPLDGVRLLQERGYDAASVTAQGMGGWKDRPLWDAVQAEQRFLVTADKGFGDLRQYAPGTHAGILLLRPDEDGIRPLTELLGRGLDNYSLAELAGRTTVATPRAIRVRRQVP